MSLFKRKSKVNVNSEEKLQKIPHQNKPTVARSVSVCLLGAEGVGKSTLIHTLERFAGFPGASHTEDSCVLLWKDVQITVWETHLCQLKEGTVPHADFWYLIVGVDDGMTADLYQVLEDAAVLPFRGVFMSKSDCLSFIEDTEFIEDLQLEIEGYLEEYDIITEKFTFIQGSAYNVEITDFLDDIIRQ